MSHTTSPSPASPEHSTMRTITVALCASSKKYQQSFDALREAGELHNERVLRLQQHLAAGQACGGDASGDAGGASTAAQQKGCLSPNNGNRSMTSRTRSRRASRATSDVATAHSAQSFCTAVDSASHSILDNCLFRFLNLNYDAQWHRMVVCDSGDSTGVDLPAVVANEGSKAKAGRILSVDEHAVTDDGVRGRAEPSQGALTDTVDVVLHKVATFGTPFAVHALERWCKFAQKRRSRQCRVPLVVVDPIEKVQLLMTRSLQCKLLDSMGDDKQPVALTPRTFMWERPSSVPFRRTGGTSGSSVATPLGIHSFTFMNDEEARANGTAAERWWIAKPNKSTGPAFTHHLVMWLTRNADVTVPTAVKAALPTEARRFIIQELYVYALPVVLKVYCVGSHMSVKVNPTVNLLAHLWEHTRGSTAVDVPVTINSQDKVFFSDVASGSTASSRHTSSTASLTELPQGMSRSSTSAEQLSTPWESMIAPADRWDAFFAPGTPAHTAISKLAQNLSGYAGIGLSLYGFDLVLVPQHLAHTYQRKGARGIGRTEGATVRYDGVASSSSKVAHRSADTPELTPRPSANHSMHTSPGAGASAPPTLVPQPFHASDMFDRISGAPTSLLLDSIPVVIDVNYFPGYKGIAEANQHMLELIALKTLHVQNDSSNRMWPADAAAGKYAKKRHCSIM
ncbi:hypothetical protein Q4I30_004446 [Leishmania utingensis]|uniref:Inositol-1,3,4-trisphosphate 5/6-kinase n=1 Tax=Leishmania utingensis TaxID=653362 RepID=A0AAW3AGE3_9TRYP